MAARLLSPDVKPYLPTVNWPISSREPADGFDEFSKAFVMGTHTVIQFSQFQ